MTEKILTPPLAIGDKVYTKGYNYCRTPRTWTVKYIGWNGEWFDFHIAKDQNTMSIQDSWLDNPSMGIYYTSKEACQAAMDARKKRRNTAKDPEEE